MSQHSLTVAHPEEIGALHQLLEQVDRSDPAPADRKALSLFLREHPHLWRYVGDLMEQAMLSLIGNLDALAVARLGMRTTVEQLSDDLTRPGVGPLEQLLVQRVKLVPVALDALGVPLLGRVQAAERHDKDIVPRDIISCIYAAGGVLQPYVLVLGVGRDNSF